MLERTDRPAAVPDEAFVGMSAEDIDYWTAREIAWDEAVSGAEGKLNTALHTGADFNRRVDEATAPAR